MNIPNKEGKGICVIEKCNERVIKKVEPSKRKPGMSQASQVVVFNKNQVIFLFHIKEGRISSKVSNSNFSGKKPFTTAK